eukprot:CAMPEP_0168534524 /NCGR_PEP_ID=MMETSP0405-20121227/17987_1 /TAXON_ID=498012 /ORGANISM="Trichosphaerium sp, Strain Am-I-7 wt" /LENGTH=49 /DNA_ID= /DNA_START= /DNA_END= /DNA_ORIENTATION=
MANTMGIDMLNALLHPKTEDSFFNLVKTDGDISLVLDVGCAKVFQKQPA